MEGDKECDCDPAVECCVQGTELSRSTTPSPRVVVSDLGQLSVFERDGLPGEAMLSKS
jgi:hypothetical protein